jgi:hypothetical protein
MPTSIIANGKRTYIPGVYGQIVADGLANPGVSLGNLAIVGDFPQLQQNVPTKFNSAKALINFDTTDIKLARLAKLAFSPSLDTRVTGATSVTLVSAQVSVQALGVFKDTNAADVLSIKSQVWGTKGNSVWVKIADNGVNKDINITAPGKTAEQYKAIGAAGVVNVKLTTGVGANTSLSGASDTATFSLLSDIWKLEWTKRLTNNGDTNLTSAFVPVSGRSLYVKASAASGADITITVTGTGLKAGNIVTSATFTLTNANQNNTYVEIKDGVDTVTWLSVTKIANNYAGGNTLDVRGTAFSYDATQYNKVSEIVGLINNDATAFISASIDDPRGINLAPTEVDKVDAVTCKDANAAVNAHLWAILQALAGSSIVTATRVSGAKLPPVAATKMLSSGAVTASDTTTRAAALATLENVDIQTVTVMSTDVEDGKALVTHCVNAASKFGRERDATFGAPGGTTLSSLKKDFAAKINSRNVSVYGDKIKIAPVASGDVATWLDPSYTAILAAGCMCGQAPGQALTRRTVDVLDISHSWTDGDDWNDVISGGISALTTNDLGQFVFLRSVTSWLSDNTPAFSEMSANASINISIRDLRAYLNALIGTTISAGIVPGTIEAIVRGRLDTQMNSYEWIRGYSNVKATLLVDSWSIDYLVDELQPVNFILVTEHVKAG